MKTGLQALKINCKFLRTQKVLQGKTVEHDHDMQELRDNFKRPSMIIIEIKENMKIQTKGLNNIFKEVVAENSHRRNEIDIHKKKTYRTQKRGLTVK